MKRRILIKHLEDHNCHLLREGNRHTVFVNRKVRKSAAIPRHREINEILVKRICKDLEVPSP